MAGKEPLHREFTLNAALTDRAVLARDLAQWLEDREAALLGNRELARGRLERRTQIPKGVFWSARHRARESLGRWLNHLIAARVAVLRGEIHELETTLAVAQGLDRPDLQPEIAAAEFDLSNARDRLAVILAQGRGR